MHHKPETMKKTLPYLILLFISTSLYGTSKDSLIFESDSLRISQNRRTSKYTIRAKETYEDLLFVKRINNYFQVLDAYGKVFYINNKGSLEEEVQDVMMVCGTVPHFDLIIKDSADYFQVFEDETFYDHDQKVPAEKIFQISKAEVDSVFLLNGRQSFQFTSNFSIPITISDPRIILLAKDGQFFSATDPEEKFDNIDFSHYWHYLITQKGAYYGILGSAPTKYLQIEKFNYYLAKAQDAKGRVLYLDLEGNEYYPKKSRK